MAFDLFGKRKKYPHNKKKAAPPAAVYAGPEYFRRRAGQTPEEEVLDVYAGPEYYEEPLTPPEEIGKVFEDISFGWFQDYSLRNFRCFAPPSLPDHPKNQRFSGTPEASHCGPLPFTRPRAATVFKL